MSPITRGVEKFGKIPYHTIGANLTLIEQSTQEKRPVQSVPYFSQILSLTWGPPQRALLLTGFRHHPDVQGRWRGVGAQIVEVELTFTPPGFRDRDSRIGFLGCGIRIVPPSRGLRTG
jgi:hypothetical protein